MTETTFGKYHGKDIRVTYNYATLIESANKARSVNQDNLIKNTDNKEVAMKKDTNDLDVEVLLDKLAKAVSFRYPGKCAPSVIVSWLPNKSWYVSIVRYEESFEKVVMHKARNTSLLSALKDISEQLLKAVVKERDPLDDLDLCLR